MGNATSKRSDEKHRYALDEKGNMVYTTRYHPENWALYLKESWEAYDVHKDFSNAMKMIVLGSEMELFEGQACTTQNPFLKNLGYAEGDLLVGFRLITPDDCTVTLYIDSEPIQEIHLHTNEPVAAIGNAYPLSLLQMYNSTVKLGGSSEFEVVPIFALLNRKNRNNLLMLDWCIPETESTDVILFSLGKVTVRKNVFPVKLRVQGHLMPLLRRRNRLSNQATQSQ